jgi:hypothetical protein
MVVVVVVVVSWSINLVVGDMLGSGGLKFLVVS